MQPAASRVQLESNEALTAGCSCTTGAQTSIGKRTTFKNYYSLLLYCVLAANLHRFRAESVQSDAALRLQSGA